MLKRLGVDGKAVIIDVAPDEKLARSVRNIPGVSLLPSGRVTARDVMHATRVVATTKRAGEAAGGAGTPKEVRLSRT